MSQVIAPLCQQGPVLHAYTGKANTHPIYSNATPWRVAVTISFGEPGSFGAAGGIDSSGDDLWTVLHVNGKQVAITFGHGASTATVIVEPGHAVTASADGGHLVYSVLGAIALADERVDIKGIPAPKPHVAKRTTTAEPRTPLRAKARRRSK